MSEVQSRPAPRGGRSSARGGRGGFTSRAGGRGGARGHATSENTSTTASIEQNNSEVVQLKKKHGSKVSTIQELFPGWTDEDVVMALEETDGDLESTVERISEGTISQWGEVSNKKDRSKSKAHDSTSSAPLNESTNTGRVSRGGRGGFDGTRGRGRGNDRGRGGRTRGAPVAHTNGTRNETAEVSVPTTESNAWDTAATTENTTKDTPADAESSKPAEADNTWGATATNAASTTAAAATTAASTIIPDGVKKSWASMFAPAPKPKKAPEPVEKPVELPKPEEPVEAPAVSEPEPPVPEPETVEIPEPIAPVESPAEPEVNVNLTPSKDELTETNLEQVPDDTAASSWDPRNAPGNATGNSTPYSALPSQTTAASRAPTSGFQASALKATGSSGRTPSFQRRVLDQEEAVRMPGNREVDRAAVQFGAFNLTGEDDVDGDREEPETRAQPPQHSPVAPRATLPPAPQQAAPVSETLPTPKQAPGLPAATHPTAAPGLPSPQTHPSSQSAPQQGSQAGSQLGQYGRYGQPGSQEQSSLPQKPYDAFSQQAPSSQSPFEGYPSQSQSQAQQQSGAFSSAPNDYSSYYTSDPQRQNYNSYYQQQYNLQQGGQGQQDASSSQRSYGGYNGPQTETSGQQSQSRYATAGAGEGQNSGHTTPNPVAQSQQQTGAAAQTTQPQPSHSQQPQGAYPYGHPYYQTPYYNAYMSQFQQAGGYGGYGGSPYGGGKGGIHGQPYQGYMSPGAPYDHTSTPAAGGFAGSSLHGRDSAVGGGLGEYGRAGSSQSSQTPQALGGSGGFGAGSHDAFSRGAYPSGQHYNATQGSQPGASDDLKPFGESKTTNGPSPSLSQAGRPGSATNATPGSVLPPPQSQQGGYGGYPSHLQGHGLHGSQAGSQYGGLGGVGSHQAAGQGHQSSGYGGYQGYGVTRVSVTTNNVVDGVATMDINLFGQK
ncbi:rnapii degradation factor def1 [Botrytis cinerea]